jgi:acyl-[acyl-carrier-protein]-phospholipid O-acyltransferase/long-chain-fatty-acid--[acyl-carrier-protein] ligase
LTEVVRGSELPNLWKPKPNAFVQVDAIPQLGSGKLDLSAIRQLAERA